jgi:hypothetical protein
LQSIDQDGSGLDLVVIPSNSNISRKLMQQIKLRTPHIRNMIISGRITSQMKKVISKMSCLVWDESTYQERLAKTVATVQKMPSIPVVMVKGAINDVQMLFDLYAFEGYNVKIVSNINMAYLYGVNYVTNDVDIDAYFALLEQRLYCDIIILWTDSCQTSTSIDLSITLPIGITQDQIRTIYEWVNKKLIA